MRKYTTEEATRPAPQIEPHHFTGLPLLKGDMPRQLNVTMVRFETGVRNHWHRHTGGQVLHVVEGEGYVQARGGAVQRIRPGDTVSIEPDEVHWHGAAEGGPMAHLAVNGGETLWLEPTEDVKV
jgi:quercetin dioxygenase-like cupin family protein